MKGEAFYATAAAVIPVLFVAAVLVARFLTVPREGDSTLGGIKTGLVRVFAVAAMLLGEVAALRALSLGHAPSHDKVLVGLALLVGMAVVVFPYLNNSKRYSTAVHTTVVVVAAAYVVGLVAVLNTL